MSAIISARVSYFTIASFTPNSRSIASRPIIPFRVNAAVPIVSCSFILLENEDAAAPVFGAMTAAAINDKYIFLIFIVLL